MILLPPKLRAALPHLYTQEKVEDPTVHIKFFTPWTSWTWFVTEGEEQEDTFMFFGHIIGQEEELGYFTLRHCIMHARRALCSLYSFWWMLAMPRWKLRPLLDGHLCIVLVCALLIRTTWSS